MKFKKGDLVVLSARGKEVLKSPPDMLIRIALTYINKYSAEVVKMTDYYVGLRYLVNDGAKGYWLDRMPLLAPELLDLKVHPNESKVKREVLEQLVFKVGLSIVEAVNLYEKARKFLGYSGTEKTPREAGNIAFILGLDNELEEFRFTYGSSSSMPFHAGWTTVEAQSMFIAEALLLQRHPVKDGVKPYGFCYSDDEWYKIDMRNRGNFGEFEVEKIVQPSKLE